jgi:hypothetical protein
MCTYYVIAILGTGHSLIAKELHSLLLTRNLSLLYFIILGNQYYNTGNGKSYAWSVALMYSGTLGALTSPDVFLATPPLCHSSIGDVHDKVDKL